METGIQRVLETLRSMGSATRPALARATGLSAVSVDKILERLCRTGYAARHGYAASEGGRPARLYRFRTESAQVGYFRLWEQGTALRGRMDFLDLGGELLQREEASFAYLEAQVLDTWVDAAMARRPLARLCLEEHPAIHSNLVEHLRERYGCPVYRIGASDALADKREDGATLVLFPGREPLCSMCHGGRMATCRRLDRLPLPAAWKELDYTDHTLVEEMVARLLLILTCTLDPPQITLYAPFWNQKLINRIRFNTHAKLNGSVPPLHFRRINEESAAQAMLRHAVQG